MQYKYFHKQITSKWGDTEMDNPDSEIEIDQYRRNELIGWLERYQTQMKEGQSPSSGWQCPSFRPWRDSSGSKSATYHGKVFASIPIIPFNTIFRVAFQIHSDCQWDWRHKGLFRLTVGDWRICINGGGTFCHLLISWHQWRTDRSTVVLLSVYTNTVPIERMYSYSLHLFVFLFFSCTHTPHTELKSLKRTIQD